MKDEFLSVVSHELRTPLTSIRGSLGLLASGKLGDLTPRAGSMVTIALQSSERLTRLINDLLDIERIESGNRPMEVTAHDAQQLLAAAAKHIDGLATSVGVRVEVGACAGRVLADEDGIMQTMTNLLGNAIKYSDPGETVVLDATEGEGLVLFRVQTRAGASRPTSSRASSSGSSRSTRPTPARRAARASAWRSAARSSNGTGAGSGRRASWAWGPPCSSRPASVRRRAVDLASSEPADGRPPPRGRGADPPRRGRRGPGRRDHGAAGRPRPRGGACDDRGRRRGAGPAARVEAVILDLHLPGRRRLLGGQGAAPSRALRGSLRWSSTAPPTSRSSVAATCRWERRSS